MTEITNAGSAQAALEQYSTENRPQQDKSNELGKNEFMELLVAQMNNQNPLEPQDNTEFIAQLAQFSTVEGIENMNTSLGDMSASLRSSQALQASSLVGQQVVVPNNDYGFLQSGEVIAGYADVPATTMNLQVQIKDSAGQTLETIALGQHDRGPVALRWDGANLEMDGELVDLDRTTLNRKEVLTDSEGNVLTDGNGTPIPAPYPPGEYKFVITASIDGTNEGLDTAMGGKVDSVTIGNGNAVTVNLAGGTKAALSDIKQIME